MQNRHARPRHRAALWIGAAIAFLALGALDIDSAAAAPRPLSLSLQLAHRETTAVAPARTGGTKRATPRRKAARKRPTGRAAAARGPAWVTSRDVEALRAGLSGILGSSTRGGRWGAIIVSLTRGDTLFSENPDALLQPASTMKLMTTAVALDRFGPDHRFGTDVLRDGAVANGVLAGNLYLRGGGDPSFSTRFLARGETPPMDSLAKLVAATGIKRVHGDLVADASAFDDERIPAGWQSRYLRSAYAAPVSALSINENLVWIVVQPVGKTASVALDPATTAMPVVNHVRVVGGRGGRITARRLPDGSMDVRGTIGASSGPLRYSYVIDDPTTFSGGALRASLEKLGVTVDGSVRVGRTPAQAAKVASIPSQPLGRIVAEMNRESINHFAELLFRDAAHAAQAGQVGSAATGLHTLREFLAAKVGADSTRIRVADGSGLSVNDSVTARLMVQLLAYAHESPWSSTFHASLPVAGESALLKRHMKFTPAQGNLHAKTGTTNTVGALAGYVTARDGEVIAFSFMYNGAERWQAKAAMDRMGATLADFVR